MTLCAIWYHLYNSKYVKNNLGGVLLLVKLRASACNFTKSNTPPWVFFMFFQLYKWYQIAQSVILNYSIHNYLYYLFWIVFTSSFLISLPVNNLNLPVAHPYKLLPSRHMVHIYRMISYVHYLLYYTFVLYNLFLLSYRF